MRGTLAAAFAAAYHAGSAALAAGVSPDEARAIARDAYIYAYPMVMMEVSGKISTNVTAPHGNTDAPVNQFGSARAFPDPNFTVVVRPNADTLYSSLVYDLSKEPLVITVPDSQGRYYLLPMLDKWTDVFAVPGTRTTGNGAQTFAIVGPNWQGSLPEGVGAYRNPTAQGWIGGRVKPTARPTSRPCMVPRRSQGGSSEGLRQGLHAADERCRSEARHERAARSGRENGSGRLLRDVRGADEGEPSGRQRLSDPGPHEAHRHRAGEKLLAGGAIQTDAG